MLQTTTETSAGSISSSFGADGIRSEMLGAIEDLVGHADLRSARALSHCFAKANQEVNHGQPESAEFSLREALSIREQSTTTKADALVEATMELGHCLLQLDVQDNGATLLDRGTRRILAETDASPSLRKRTQSLREVTAETSH